MNQLELIGKVAAEYLRQLLTLDQSEEGVARFLIDRLTGEQVAVICNTIIQNTYLKDSIDIKVPRKLVSGLGLSEEYVTDEKTTYWRNASCEKSAIMLANTNDDQGQSLRDITKIGAGDLKAQTELWVRVAGDGLTLTEEHKKYWQQALKGLQEANESSLEQFSEYIVMVREKINEDGFPVTRALGWALPALRIPRDSYYFDQIPEKALGHVHRWRKKYQEAYSKRACYLHKLHPNRQVIENAELQKAFDKIKEHDQMDERIWPIIDQYIISTSHWTQAAGNLAELEWETDNIRLLFSDIRPMKVNIAEKTLRLYGDQYPEILSDEEVLFLENLRDLLNKRSMEATDEDKEFYDNHKQELEADKLLKSEWDRFVYGKPIECSDFFVGLLEACDRLFNQSVKMSGNKTLKIRTRKETKKAWMDLNEDVGLFFCIAYRGLEKLTSFKVEWSTHYLFKYDELVSEWKKRSDYKKNISTAKTAVQIEFYIELINNDLPGDKNDIKLVWTGNPALIGYEQYDDLKRLSERPFSYSPLTMNPVSKKGKLQSLSLSDVGTLEAVFDRDRGSLIGVYSKSSDLEKEFIMLLKMAQESGRVTLNSFTAINEAWNDFSTQYHNAIKEWIVEGISSESLLLQAESYDLLLRVLSEEALGDINRINLWHKLALIGNVQVEGRKPASIIAPWHPLRMAAKYVKARQLTGLINHILSSEDVDFGDSKLFFNDIKMELLQPYYPEVAVGFIGQEPTLLAATDSLNEYTLMESPVREEDELETNEDPRGASKKLLALVEKYLKLQPHEKTNLSVVLFNCDSTRLPETIVTELSNLHDSEDEVRCQVILRHRDTQKLSNLYMKMVESTDSDPDSLVASEVTRDFMARLRIGVMADEAPVRDPKEGKLADIVFLQDVISRQAEVIWDPVQVYDVPSMLHHYPPRWSKRRATVKDELKSTVYLVCPIQPTVGWSYLTFIHSIIKKENPISGHHYLPARQISFQDEHVKAVFEEAHKLGEWVVNYDSLLERKQLRTLGVKVIKYQHNRSQGSNLVVSTKSQLNLLNVLVKRRLDGLNLNISGNDLAILTEQFVDEANSLSGDIVLRAAKRGVFAGELIGVVLSKALLLSEMRVSPSEVGWYFLDDYASWLGQKEEQIADILALCPAELNGEPYLKVLVSEAKFVDAKGFSEAKKNSQKQLRDTVNRMQKALFGSPDRLDRDLWLSRLSDLLNEGIELSHGSSLSIERWREGIRKGIIPIQIKGYSHIFLSTLPDTALESERVPVGNVSDCYQEVYTRELVRELVLAIHNGSTLLPIRKKLDVDEPWKVFNAELPTERVNLVTEKEDDEIDKENMVIEKGNAQNDVSSYDRQSFLEQKQESENHKQEHVAESQLINWATRSLSDWIEKNTQGESCSADNGAWVTEIVNRLRSALINYNLQAKVLGSRLTPNAIFVRLRGSDQIKVDDIDKRRSTLLTTYALDVINVMAQPGEIVVSLARSSREIISLAEVWRRRKIQIGASGLNMNFVVGVKELDGELLYLNLGGEFENHPQHAPHTLIAGSTGSGKSVLLQNLILDICATNNKNLAHIYLIDPKSVDYLHLEKLPHLVEGIIDDQNKATSILEQLVIEMDHRYKQFKEMRVNNLKDYNSKVSIEQKLPLIFLIHDEFADWMLVEQYRNAVSSSVQRLGVKARAAGIHLIFAAQRPDANVLPVQLRDNLGNRLILRVESVGTSEISLGERGAEKLLGKGHLAARLQGEVGLIYAQVPFLSDEDLIDISETLS